MPSYLDPLFTRWLRTSYVWLNAECSRLMHAFEVNVGILCSVQYSPINVWCGERAERENNYYRSSSPITALKGLYLPNVQGFPHATVYLSSYLEFVVNSISSAHRELYRLPSHLTTTITLMSIFRSLYATLSCFPRRQTHHDETAECHPVGFSYNDGKRNSSIILPSSLLKDPVRFTLPTITVETTEVYTKSFNDEDLEAIYRELFPMGPDLVPHMRTVEWLSECDGYLAEFIRREGRGTHTTDTCFNCWSDLTGGGHRCMDCFDDALYCASCIVASHISLCLHRIRTWNGKFFSNSVTLKGLGMRVQLGHSVGERCCSPHETRHGRKFMVIDITGIHEVAVDYCGCAGAVQPHLQLLYYGWFPSSSVEPCVAATFSILGHFQLLSSQSKVTALEFYKSLSRMTDNTSTSQPKDLYPSFLLIVNQWCRIKSMKRAGRGNDPGGIASTPAGASVVECPACPHPGMNVPEDVPPTKSLEVDASFRLKCKEILCDHLRSEDLAVMDSAVDSRSEREIRHGNIDRPLNACHSDLKVRTLKEKIITWAAAVFRLGTRHEKYCERNWSSLDSFRTSVYPISCQIPLWDDFGDRNWQKITAIPTTYLCRIEAAVRERKAQRATFKDLNDLLVAEQMDEWSTSSTMCEADPNYVCNQYQDKHRDEPLHIQWRKAHAHAQESDEQVQVLLEEMRRVVVFHKCKAEWWEDQLGRTFLERPQYLEGADAYAHRQAAIRRALGSHCLHSWRFVPSYVACDDVGARLFPHGDNDIDTDLASHADLSSDFDFLTFLTPNALALND